MPGQDDRSSGSQTLPSAELNPLLNPLLAENMGRWAEVYFTSPPEKREQAVLELLRELEAKRSQQDQNQEPIRASDSALAQTRVKTAVQIRCGACGGENPVSNKYCGTCGAGLGEARAYSIFRDPDSLTGSNGHEYSPNYEAEERAAEDDQIQTSARQRYEERHETQYNEESRNGSYPDPRELRRPSNGNSLSLLQLTDSDSDETVDWTYEPEPSPPYRYYIGAVLAIIILVLGYMAWRGTQARQNSHEVSAPPPAAASDTAAAPAPAKTAAEPTAQSPIPDASAHTSPPADATKNPPPAQSSRDRVAESTPAASVPSSTAAAQPVTPAAQPQQSAGNGGDELAIAERYLNGAVGQRRDTAEAAKWLWKSVAKHNGQATVLLSDLYLKGDGVSKNCDQARVLLDSAARKGVAGAGERLRNLPAFGCD